jgi:sulfate-transporting ATPase
VVTAALWAWTRFSRIGLAISASAQNERVVQTLGWSPDRLAALTWTLGGALAGLAAVLAAPLTGLSATTFTIVVTVAGLGAALLGGFQSFPLTLFGGLIIGVGESMATLYGGDITRALGQSQITGLNRLPAFLVIIVVVVIRGRGLPLRSHVASRLPRLGTGRISPVAVLVGVALALVLLFGLMNDTWAQATYLSASAALMLLSIVVLTGYTGQISLAQWALAGIGALVAAQLVRHGAPVELAIPAGMLAAIPVGLIVAIPALRTRGVNLAVVTLGLGFLVSEVVFANPAYLGERIDGGTRIGRVRLLGLEVDAYRHPHAWAAVCLVIFALAGLAVANLRRSRTGGRLLAVRTNERAAASLGISVFGVKLYAFAVSSALAALAGILMAFRGQLVTYEQFNVFASINSLGNSVIGGLGYAVGPIFGGPMIPGGFGTRITEDWVGLRGGWDLIIGSLALFVILIAHQNGIADVVVHQRRRVERLRTARPQPPAPVETTLSPVRPASLRIEGLSVKFGTALTVDDVSLTVAPGEVVGLIGPNGAGKTTFIDAVTGFVEVRAGRIYVGDHNLDGLSPSRRARLGLRRSFQSLELFDDVTVEENLRAGADLRASRWSWVTDLFWPGRQDLPATAVAAVQEFDLETHLRKTPEELPYGLRRLVGIARTVASGPSVVLLDEPAAGLDESESRHLERLIRRLADERGMAVLLVEHDVRMVMSICDRIVVLNDGRVIAQGTPSEVRMDEAVREAYLGSAESAEAVHQ